MKIIYTFDEVKYLNGVWLCMNSIVYEHLAKKYGVSVRTVKNWEKKNQVPAKYPMQTVKENIKENAK